jgi:crossover junction endodeoxyribonuclease RuvC
VTSLVVGLDLSLTSAGYAVVGEGTPVTSSVTSKGAATASLEARWARLAIHMARIITESRALEADLVVIEAPAFSRTTGSQHDRSGLWWLIVSHLHAVKRPVLEIAPNLRAKYATGKGNSGKDEVVIAVTRRYPGVEVKTNDEADALVLAAIGRRLLGEPLEASLPQTHLDALKTVELPFSVRPQP